MDKNLLKAYIRVIVEEEVKKILPELLSEAVKEVKQLKESVEPETTIKTKKPMFDRQRLKELMNLEYDGTTLVASTTNMQTPTIVPSTMAKDVDPAVVNVINRDYSQLMKKLKLT